MTSAVAGIGTLLKAGDGGGTEVFTTIAEIKNIDGPNVSLETIDATTMDSPGGAREFIGGLINNGTLSCSFNYIGDNVTQNNLETDLKDKKLRNFQLLMTNTAGTLISFSALVIEFSRSFEIESLNNATINLQISGEVTIA